MALYRTGTASMDAQGVITGVGTKWREPLSLIRTGATIVFLTTPLTLAVISDIVSDTEMKAIQTDGAVVPDGNYVILLNDSLTVDGMAQDVAETLRYYQSKETEIADALEFFRDFDLQGLKDLVARIEQTANDTDQAKLDAQAAQAGAEASQQETNQIKQETQTIKDSAVTELTQIKDQAVAETTSIKNEALDARDAAEEAKFAAEESKAGANTAKAGAETARDDAQRWAQQVNPENLLHKDKNLSDVQDKELARNALDVPAKSEAFLIGNNLSEIADRAAAWLNVRPIGATPLSGDPVNDDDATTKRWVVNYVGGLTEVNRSWSVINSDSTTPPSGVVVEGGSVTSSYKVGTSDFADASFTVRASEGGATYARLNIKRAGVPETNFDFVDDGQSHTIGNAAFRNVDTRDAIKSPGEAGLMQQNARDFRGITSYALLGSYPLGVSSAIMRGDQGWEQASSALVGVLSSRNWFDNSGAEAMFQIGINRNGAGYKIAIPSGETYYLSDVIKFRDERNTTVDANGFIKTASPIVKLFGDGTCETNDQAKGALSERISEGVYRVSGVLGFNSNAEWGGYEGGFEIPKNSNGLPMLWIDYSIEPNGDILLKTYHRTHENAPSFANNVIDGYSDMSPIDIPYGRWVDLRVQMPQQEDEE